jgi:anti-anti-sigma factor
MEIVRLPNVTEVGRPISTSHNRSHALGLCAVLPTLSSGSPSPMPDIQAERIAAPPQLIITTREAFRLSAIDAISRASRRSAASLVVDFSNTECIDASGLGVLVLVRRRAQDRGLAVRLECPPMSLRQLLSVTKLDALFEMND